jgi:Uma2 family endonuclease
MAMTDARMTADDYFDAVASVREATQLIDGVIVLSQPKFRHQRAVGIIHAALFTWVRSADGGGLVSLPVDVVVDRYNVYAPDVLWIRDTDRVDLDQYFHGVPDLAVEVRSPSSWHYDIGVKKRRYEQHGLPELWLVDTAASVVMVFRRSSATAPEFDVEFELAVDEVLTSPQLAGFALPLVEIFGPD